MDSELEQYVDKLVNDENPKEVISFAELEQDRLVKLIEDHNQICVDACDNKARCGYQNYDRDCGNCTKDWMIEI